MCVALTGATGFVGSHTVSSLLAAGHSPRILVRDRARAQRILGGLDVDPSVVETVVGDLADVHAIDRLLSGVDALTHCATVIQVTGPPGALTTVNVEDTSNIVGRAVEAGLGPRRLMLGGHHISWPDYASLCDELTGTRCRRVTMPAAELWALGSTLDAIKRVRPFHYPLTCDAAEIMSSMVPTDDGPTLESLPIALRPLRDTVEEAIAVLAAAGDLPAPAAGRLAPAATEASHGVVRREGLIGRATQAMAASAWFAKFGPSVVPRLDRALHRVTGGRVRISRLLVPSLVLTTTGHRSREPRQAPLACLAEPGGSLSSGAPPPHSGFHRPTSLTPCPHD